MARPRGNPLRNQRPAPRKRNLTLEQRRARAVCGAQFSPTLDRWIGFMFDGNYTTTFDPRTNRARALRDAHDHYDRVFHPEAPTRKWTRAA